MRQVFGGASLIVVAFALGALDQRNKPVDAIYRYNEGGKDWESIPASGLSHTAYDVLRVGAWALIVFGVLLIIVGLMQYRAQLRR